MHQETLQKSIEEHQQGTHISDEKKQITHGRIVNKFKHPYFYTIELNGGQQCFPMAEDESKMKRNRSFLAIRMNINNTVTGWFY